MTVTAIRPAVPHDAQESVIRPAVHYDAQESVPDLGVQADTERSVPASICWAHTHQVTVVEAPEGIPVTRLAYLKTNDLSTIIVVPNPGEDREFAIGTAVLEALGKRLDVIGLPRKPIERAELVTIWLNAHRVKRLIVAPSQRASPKLLTDLVNMTEATPTQVILAVDHGFADEVLFNLRATSPVQVPWPELPADSAAFDRADIRHDASTWQPESTVLPDVEYWVFLATARRLLTPERLAPVEALYRDTTTRLTTWLGTLGDNAEDLTVDLAFGALKALIEEQETLDDVTVTVRATQAALHRHGWYLGVDERELRNGLIRFPPAKTSPETYTALRCYFEPTRAATVALYLAGARPDAIQDLTMDDLAQWHHDPNTPVAEIHPPDQAAPYLRAALLIGAFHGTPPDQPALPGTKKRVLTDIRQAANDLGLNIGDANLERDSVIGERRIPQRILKLERIT